jgi:SAM-dependent methyltransferase
MLRWTDLTIDPNSHTAHDYRFRRLKAALRPPVDDRLTYLAALARGKRVLDLGIVNHTAEATTSASWLHDRIRAVADYCLGLDVLEPALMQLQAKGYNVRKFDVTGGEHLGETFDLIVAGELIEHLGSPERLFEFAREHLRPGGRFVLSTPHPYYITRVMLFLRGRSNESTDHTALYFPSGIAELAERAGMQLVEYCGVSVPIRTWKGRLILALGRRLRLSSEMLCDTLLFTCEAANGASLDR